MKRKTIDNFIMLPIVDFCFKELMQNPKVRQGFIAALLAVNPATVKKTELLPTALPQEHADDKLGILDVRVKLIDGTQMDFEMQVATFDYWEKRILFYLSKMYTEQLKKGESYEKLQKCIHVSILNFNHFPEDSRCYRTISFCDVTTGNLYSDLMEIKILELKKLRKDIPNQSSVYEWMKFFNGKSREEFESMAQTDEYIGEACEALKRLSADEKMRLEYEAREKALRDYNSQVKSYYERGHAAGQDEGRLSKLTELTLHLQEKGLSVEEIADFLMESPERIQEILKQNHPE